MAKILVGAVLALCFCAARADVYYPWPVRDPVPPVVTIDPIQVATGSDPAPSCNPSNDDCEVP